MITFVRLAILANVLWVWAYPTRALHTGATPTFDAALMATALPLFLNFDFSKLKNICWNTAAWYVLATAIYFGPLNGGATVVAVFLAQGMGYLFLKNKKLFILSFILGFVGFLYTWKDLLRDNMTRIKMWATYLGHWYDYSPLWIGFGSDTFRFRAPPLAVEHLHYTWAHNDWLEILFNNGILGLVAALTFFCYLLWVSRKNTRNFCAILGFGTCMFFYAPLRVITGQLIFVAVVWEIYQDIYFIKRCDLGPADS